MASVPVDATAPEPTLPAVCAQLRIRQWSTRQPYEPVWRAMQKFTDERTDETPDELWFLQHDPVFTQGQAGKAEHVLFPGDIPVVPVDRGGQVTYHGPGQLMAYLLLDIKRRKLGTRSLVNKIEQVVIDTLAHWKIEAHVRDGMPGVYVADAKIASLGLRVRRGRTYHGMAFNLDMDLSPFQRINPCGYQDMAMTQLCDHAPQAQWDEVVKQVLTHLQSQLGYTECELVDHTDYV